MILKLVLGYFFAFLVTLTSYFPLLQILIDGPENLTGVSRQVINLKWVSLTDLKVKITLNARQNSLNKAWTAADILNKWNNLSWAKKIAAKEAKKNSTDFERFTVKVNKQKVSKAVKASLGI